jgi:hypothetical protein
MAGSKKDDPKGKKESKKETVKKPSPAVAAPPPAPVKAVPAPAPVAAPVPVAKAAPVAPSPAPVEAPRHACAKCGKKVHFYESVDSSTGKGYCSIECLKTR